MNAVQIQPGLADRVHDAQRAFRAVLQALSRPGRIERVGRPLAGLPLGPAMAHLLLTLADEDTPVWWQPQDAGLAQWLRFHTGAATAGSPGEARFAVVTEAARMPGLDAFNPGSLASPETSCTLLVELRSLREGPLLHGEGPGIASRAPLRLAGLADGFWAGWQANHAAFPQGVDAIFCCGDEVLGLPRTTRVVP